MSVTDTFRCSVQYLSLMLLRTAAICLRSLKCTSPDSLNSADDSFSRMKGSHTMVFAGFLLFKDCNTDTVRHTQWLRLARGSYYKSCCTHLKRYVSSVFAPSFVLCKKEENLLSAGVLCTAASTNCVVAGAKLPALQRHCSSSFQSYVQVWLGRSGSRWRGNS